MDTNQDCPICNKSFSMEDIQEHVNKCLFLSSNSNSETTQRNISSNAFPQRKKMKTESSPKAMQSKTPSSSFSLQEENPKKNRKLDVSIGTPLAEQMRPTTIDQYSGQCHILGTNKLLRKLLMNRDIPSMILWGPPGCGKTSLANVISVICKNENNMRFVKISATMSGISDVKEIVKVAKNDMAHKRKTVLFMDEIHRFNKLQQDSFLPHVEAGTIILIGATTENPSFSLNSALLSRCRVVVLEKLNTENIMSILKRALITKYDDVVINNTPSTPNTNTKPPRVIIETESLQWLSEICDGDARIALNSLQLAIQSKDPWTSAVTSPALLSLDDIKDGIKRSHLMYDRKGEEHYNMISAMHKSIRASDDNAALYWLTRMIQGGEDPLYIARRLIRIAGEDIGLADSQALTLAVSCMQGCQLIGMLECDVLLAQCAVYLARTKKSTEVYHALKKCQSNINDCKGPLPSVPLHLRNAPTKLMSKLGYGKGYNTQHKDVSNLTYLPESMEPVNFFKLNSKIK